MTQAKKSKTKTKPLRNLLNKHRRKNEAGRDVIGELYVSLRMVSWKAEELSRAIQELLPHIDWLGQTMKALRAGKKSK